MATFVYDRVCETSVTTGTGNFTLAGAVAGYQTFNNAGVSGSGEHYYLIEAVDSSGVPAGAWEVGVGLLSAPTTMQRILVLASSNAGAAVSFAAGTKRVHLTAPAYQLQLLGCVATRTTDLTAQNFTTSTAIAWNHNNIDSEVSTGFHNTVTTNTRITLPTTGYDSVLIRLSGQVSLQNLLANDWVDLKIRADGATEIGRVTWSSANTSPSYRVESQIYVAAGSQYFELMIQVASDTSIDLLATKSFFQLEVLQ